MTVKLFLLDLIAPNPYQVRLAGDPEHVTKVALSIAHSGLLQTPVGRLKSEDPNKAQLAFGHTRLAAYRQLRDEDVAGGGDGGEWRELPIDIRELTDIELFELAVRENLDRKDLSPIEEARAMAIYRDEFKKNSPQIAELFGISDSAVRNKMRLLELPAPVQASIEAGDITEGTARKLLTLQKVAPKEIEKVTADIVKGGYLGQTIDEELAEVMATSAHHLCYERGGARPTAGTGLWKLDWKGTVEKPTVGAVAKVLAGADHKVDPDVLLQVIEAFASGTDIAGVVELFGIVEPAAAIIRQLVAPPTCTSCEFHQVMDGQHYCGLEPCWEQKKTAWIAAETRRVAKKLGVAVYDPGTDGKTTVVAPETWGPGTGTILEPSWQKRLEAKDANLRMRGREKKYSEHAGTGSSVVQLIGIGALVKKAKETAKRRGKVARGGYDHEAQLRRQKEQSQRQDASWAFLSTIAAPIFADVIAPSSNEQALRLLREALRDFRERNRKIPEKPAARLAALRISIAVTVLRETTEWNVVSKGPQATAKHLAGVAKTLGIRLPKTWDEAAASFEPAVSTETGKEESEEE